jgi:pimeloyl-ACP methyl ester carboxylesterase
MVEANRILGMYLHLARASQARRQPLVRDKLLILAGVQAEEMGLGQISALCRQKILARNAHHLVRTWPTMTAALADDEFQSYLKQLKRRYSPEKVEHMVHSLGIELGRERDAYFDDCEYAAALLNTRPESIDRIVLAGAAAEAQKATASSAPISLPPIASLPTAAARIRAATPWLVATAVALAALALALVVLAATVLAG